MIWAYLGFCVYRYYLTYEKSSFQKNTDPV
jgi:hypothetical protein